jgi:hypothetical protein
MGFRVSIGLPVWALQQLRRSAALSTGSIENHNDMVAVAHTGHSAGGTKGGGGGGENVVLQK